MPKLYLGVKKVDITPEIGGALIGYMPDWHSESIHDNLDATAFVFRQGDTVAVLVSATVCVIQKELSEIIRQRIEKELGVDADNVIIAATHTHSGPATGLNIDWDYCEHIFIPRIMEAVKQAKENMQAVTIGYACGESLVGVNRRENYKNNGITLGQCPWGPFDPRMTVVSFKNEEQKIVASMIHYGAHGTSAGMNKEVTQDWAGVMVRRIEALTGATAAFFNGAIGDVGPRISNGKTMGDIHYTEELGGVAAQDATRILRTVTQHTEGDLKYASSTVTIPLKKRMPLEQAQQKLNACVASKYDSEIALRKHYEDVVASYENGYQEQESVSVEQKVLRIGNIVFVSFVFEIFSEIAMRIQKENKNFVILPLTNANAYMAYFPTQSQLCRGGYEVENFQTRNLQEFVDDADYHLICQSLKNIEKVV